MKEKKEREVREREKKKVERKKERREADRQERHLKKEKGESKRSVQIWSQDLCNFCMQQMT